MTLEVLVGGVWSTVESHEFCVDGTPSSLPVPASKPSAHPSLEEVVEYGSNMGMAQDDCEAFFDHFTSNGWKVGGKAPMKDWRAALRNWKRNAKARQQGKPGVYALFSRM